MDQRDRFVSLVQATAQTHGLAGYWEFIGTAAGLPEAVQRCLDALDPSELRRGALSEKTGAPSIVAQRVEAVSVSRPAAICALYNELCDADDAIPTVQWARRACRAFLNPPTVDPNAEPWSWAEALRMEPLKTIPLELRPLSDKHLDLSDLLRAIESGGTLLMAARKQGVSIDPRTFEYWLSRMDSTDPETLAALVDLSRLSGFDPQRWRAAYTPIFERLSSAQSDARRAIPLVYLLLNPAWSLPPSPGIETVIAAPPARASEPS